MKVTDAWSTYWLGGHANSFVPEGMETPFSGIWQTLSEDLDEQSHILDLCCGNGAIAWQFESGQLDKSFKITGVDMADIQAKSSDFKRHNTNFIGKTDVSSLAFGDASFDAIVSQFGVEYSEWNASLKEAVRVSKPGAKLCFIMHCHDSLIAKNVEKQLAVSKFIKESDFFEGFAEFFSLLDDATEGNDLSLQIRIDESNKKLAKISSSLADYSDKLNGSSTIVSLLEMANEMFENRNDTSLEKQIAQLTASQMLNYAAIERMENMLAVSLDEEQIVAFTSLLNRLGVETEVKHLTVGDAKIANCVLGTLNG